MKDPSLLHLPHPISFPMPNQVNFKYFSTFINFWLDLKKSIHKLYPNALSCLSIIPAKPDEPLYLELKFLQEINIDSDAILNLINLKPKQEPPPKEDTVPNADTSKEKLPLKEQITPTKEIISKELITPSEEFQPKEETTFIICWGKWSPDVNSRLLGFLSKVPDVSYHYRTINNTLIISACFTYQHSFLLNFLIYNNVTVIFTNAPPSQYESLILHQIPPSLSPKIDSSKFHHPNLHLSEPGKKLYSSFTYPYSINILQNNYILQEYQTLLTEVHPSLINELKKNGITKEIMLHLSLYHLFDHANLNSTSFSPGLSDKDFISFFSYVTNNYETLQKDQKWSLFFDPSFKNPFNDSNIDYLIKEHRFPKSQLISFIFTDPKSKLFFQNKNQILSLLNSKLWFDFQYVSTIEFFFSEKFSKYS
jgi:hypothetical protein